MKQNWACVLAPHLVNWVAPWEGYLTTLKLSFCICKIRILKTIATLQRCYETVTSSCVFTRQHSSRYNARARETYVIITLCTNDKGKGECWFWFLLHLVCGGGGLWGAVSIMFLRCSICHKFFSLSSLFLPPSRTPASRISAARLICRQCLLAGELCQWQPWIPSSRCRLWCLDGKQSGQHLVKKTQNTLSDWRKILGL